VLSATVEALILFSPQEPGAAIPALAGAAQRELDRGRLRAAEALSGSALRIADDLTDRRVAVPAYLVAARLCRVRGRLEEAEGHYSAALELARRGGEVLEAATSAIGLGNLEVDRAKWGAARRWYDVAEELLTPVQEPAPHRWHLALNRCILSREEGNLDSAEAFLARARSLAHGAPEAKPIIGNARGQLAFARGDLEGAEAAFRAALADATSAEARITIRVNLAETLLARGHLLFAEDEARVAEEEAVHHGVVSRLPEVYRMLGQVASASEVGDAFLFFERALEVIHLRALPVGEHLRVLEAYADLQERRGETASATALRREAQRLGTLLERPFQ